MSFIVTALCQDLRQGVHDCQKAFKDGFVLVLKMQRYILASS